MAVARRSARGAAAARQAPARKPAGPTARSGLARKASGRNEMRLAGVDRAGARKMAHKDIALLLSRKFGVPDWWGQLVTVGYEQARGLRAAHERSDGFAATASRTVHAPVDRLFDAWRDAQSRGRWLLD